MFGLYWTGRGTKTLTINGLLKTPSGHGPFLNPKFGRKPGFCKKKKKNQNGYAWPTGNWVVSHLHGDKWCLPDKDLVFWTAFQDHLLACNTSLSKSDCIEWVNVPKLCIVQKSFTVVLSGLVGNTRRSVICQNAHSKSDSHESLMCLRKWQHAGFSDNKSNYWELRHGLEICWFEYQ